MKKILIYVLANLFTNICSMENECKFLGAPDEIKLHIFELLIKNIIENNSIFEPFNDTKEAIYNISLINKEFNNFKYDLIKFTKKYVRNYFAAIYVNSLQGEKDVQLDNIFINMLRCVFANIKINNSKESKIKAAKLIIAGANPNLQIDYNSILKGEPLLTVIAKIGKFKSLIKLLIKYGAGVNAQDEYGHTALMSAVGREDINIVKLLIFGGADANMKDNCNYTALTWAIINRNKDIVNLLKN